MQRSVSVQAGKTYKLTFSITWWNQEYSDCSGSMGVFLGGNQLDTLYGTGTYSYTTTASGTGNLIFAATTGYGSDCLLEIDLDDVSVKEKVAQYTYDYLGRRVSKTLHASQTTIHYAYDGDQIIAEYDGNGTLLRKFIYGPGIDEPICMITAGGTKYYYHFDGLGSVVALSNASGNIVEKYRYDVFGAVSIYSPGDEPRVMSDYGNSRMFTGREYDSETGNYYYRARYYNPSIGRFLQIDPWGFVDGVNMYRYVGNNPIVEIDPYGLFGKCGPGFWGGLIIPDHYGKANFTYACKHHDSCYEGKTEPNCRASKNKCDTSFHQNLYDECRRAYGGEGIGMKACKRRADLYAYAVMSEGQGSFDSARAKNPKRYP